MTAINSGCFKKGLIPWNKGIKMSKEFKHKCGIKNKGKHRSFKTEFKKNITPWNRGKKLPKLSEEHKRKISLGGIGKHKYWLGKKGKLHPNWRGGLTKNKEYRKKYNQTWNEENREQLNFLHRRRQYRERGAYGKHTLGEWELLKKQYANTCPSCKRAEPNIKLTEDHIIPLSKGGSDSIENIQPLCKPCNSKKHTKIEKYAI